LINALTHDDDPHYADKLRQLAVRARDFIEGQLLAGKMDKPRDGSLDEWFDDARMLIGLSTWERHPPAKHVTWGGKALCQFTMHPVERWLPGQTAIALHKLCVRLPDKPGWVAAPPPDWAGVNCDACRARVPTLLTQMEILFEDFKTGVMAAHRVEVAKLDEESP
jgi:hypothetical protein